jgi:two-component system, chemotaxis family, response regulator Rcp1
VEILVAEDNPADIDWLKEILKDTRLPHHLTIAQDGEAAVESMMRAGRYADGPVADLILLDMHLPKFGGLEVLRRVPQAAALPICILSSTDLEKNAVTALLHKPICYLTKPLSAETFLGAIQQTVG